MPGLFEIDFVGFTAAKNIADQHSRIDAARVSGALAEFQRARRIAGLIGFQRGFEIRRGLNNRIGWGVRKGRRDA